MKVETYQMIASNGRPIRKATKVVFENGQEVRFTEKMTKQQAIEQGQYQLSKLLETGCYE